MMDLTWLNSCNCIEIIGGFWSNWSSLDALIRVIAKVRRGIQLLMSLYLSVFFWAIHLWNAHWILGAFMKVQVIITSHCQIIIGSLRENSLRLFLLIILKRKSLFWSFPRCTVKGEINIRSPWLRSWARRLQKNSASSRFFDLWINTSHICHLV